MSLLDKFKQVEVMVAVPSPGVWMEPFGVSLVNMTTFFGATKLGNYKRQRLHVNSMKGSVLPKMRWSAIELAQKMNIDYLLFVDSDQTFPRGTIHRLWQHRLDCVGANISTKTMPTQPTARKLTEKEPVFGEPVYTDEGMTGVEKVWRVGTGLVLLSKKAIQAIKPQDFDMYWREDVKLHQGEDWTMFNALEKAGIGVHVDHGLSWQVGHIGYFEYKHEYTGEVVNVDSSVARAA